MPKLSLTSPNLQVRFGDYDNEKTYKSILDLANDIKKSLVSISNAVNYLYGPRSVESVVYLNHAKLGGVKDPNFVQVADDGAGSTGIYAYAFDATAEEELFIISHVSGYYTADEDLNIDLHWAPIDGTAGNVVWGLEYQWVDIGSTFSNSTIVTATVAAPGVAKQEVHSTIATITGTGHSGDSILLGRLFRKAADASDTYAADAFAFTIDFHVNETIV